MLQPPNPPRHPRRHHFLFLTVLAAASYENMPLQRQLGKEVKKVVSHRMIVGGEVSLEILQGILVYLAWYVNLSRSTPPLAISNTLTLASRPVTAVVLLHGSVAENHVTVSGAAKVRKRNSDAIPNPEPAPSIAKNRSGCSVAEQSTAVPLASTTPPWRTWPAMPTLLVSFGGYLHAGRDAAADRADDVRGAPRDDDG
ncbi:hypothetical protein V495_02808 [Pseudogymnoascus sp. VKM F-4514 (FW-929)]|nr:hypothetical protein V495_02808 [Pseudogymnoascus sp. VKM F-4514 (FW-929)]